MQTGNMEKAVRDKEVKFAASHKKEERKAELVVQLSKMQEEDSKVRGRSVRNSFYDAVSI